MKYLYTSAMTGLALACATAGLAIDSKSAPRRIPLTRPEMKQYLEDMKVRTPRIPLPDLTEEDKEKLGERSTSYESRLRYHYLPAGDSRNGAQAAGAPRQQQGGGGGRDSDPDMTLDYRFKVELFWIVSRTNNCQYCLGHQESKLLAAGMTEDEIAALDSNWSSFPANEQAAFAFARKFTFQPNELQDADIDALRKHFTDLQILEMILSMAGNNSINRWKEGAGIPQSRDGGNFGRRNRSEPSASTAAAEPTERQSYLTPTAERYQSAITSVAPLSYDQSSGQLTRHTLCRRPALEGRGEVESRLVAAAQRLSRLPLVDEAKAREFLPENAGSSAVPVWVRLLANFPTSAKSRIAAIFSAETRGDLSPKLKAQLSWIIARQDRAWYATGQAKRRLLAEGQSEEQIYALDGDWKEFTPKERALFTIARQLAATPVVLTDDEVDEAVKQAGPRDVVQVISYTTNRASFDRITEAAGLAIEKE